MYSSCKAPGWLLSQADSYTQLCTKYADGVSASQSEFFQVFSQVSASV